MLKDISITKKQARHISWEISTERRRIFMEQNNAKQHEMHALRFLSMETLSDLQKLLTINQLLVEFHVNHPDYIEFFISKKKGGQRKITAPAKHLKLVQKTLNYYLQAVYLLRRPECSHGFIIHPKGATETFNIVSNALPHSNKKFVMNIDLENFFPSISAKRVKELFEGPQFEFKGTLPSILALLCTYKKALPVGSPTSPVIANFICMEMDNEMMAFCKEKKITYTRYADDLTFSSDNYFDETIISGIRKIIRKHRFVVNEKKFRVQSQQSKQTVTGLLVNKKPNVDRRYIRKLRAILYHWKNEGLESAARKHLNVQEISSVDELSDFSCKIRGSINFVGQVRGKSDLVYRKLNATIGSCFEPFDDNSQLEIWKRPY